MAAILALALLSLAGFCRAGIDPFVCENKYGDYGQTVSCSDGYLAVSLCTSGRDPDCSSRYTDLKCCLETTPCAARACETKEGGFGSFLTCSPGYVVIGLCSSGRDPDCGNDIYNRITCCDDHSQTIGSKCYWRYGDYGVKVECGSDEVIRGVCSSGRDADCGSNAYTGVYCCPVN